MTDRHHNGLKTTAALRGDVGRPARHRGPGRLGTGSSSFIWLFAAHRPGDDVLRLLELRQAGDPGDGRPSGQRGRGAVAVRHRARARHHRAPADAAALHLPDGAAQRLRHRPQPPQRRGVLHRGDRAHPRAARAARGAGPRAHARVQPRHPHLLGGGGVRRAHHLGGAVPAVLRRAGTATPTRWRCSRRRCSRRSPPRSSSWRSPAPASSTPTRTAPSSPATRWPWPRRCASSSAAPRRPAAARPSGWRTSAT